MPEGEQRRLKANPLNVRQGRANGLLEVRQDYCAADFGSVTVVGEGAFLRIDDEDILGLHIGEGNLEVSLRLFSKTSELLLAIDRNEWVSGDPLPWDIEADWQTLTLRERARQISLTLNAREVPLQVHADLWHNGKNVKLNRDGISIAPHGVGFSNLALVGMTLAVNTEQMTLGPHAQSPQAMLISWHNSWERLVKAKDAWRRIKRLRNQPPAAS